MGHTHGETQEPYLLATTGRTCCSAPSEFELCTLQNVDKTSLINDILVLSALSTGFVAVTLALLGGLESAYRPSREPCSTRTGSSADAGAQLVVSLTIKHIFASCM
jgi:hypothetical protein